MTPRGSVPDLCRPPALIVGAHPVRFMNVKIRAKISQVRRLKVCSGARACLGDFQSLFAYGMPSSSCFNVSKRSMVNSHSKWSPTSKFHSS